MGRPSKAPVPVFWRGFAFLPSGSVQGFNGGHSVVRYEIDPHGKWIVPDDDAWPSVWPVIVVLTNAAALAAQFRLDLDTDYDSSKATIEEIRQWVDLTRSLSRRFPYGGPCAADMQGLADRVAGLQGWTRTYLDASPRTRKEESEYRFNFLLWVIHELRTTARMPRRGFWRVFERLLPDVDPQVFDEESLEKRIQRFRQKIKTDTASVLMGDALRDITRYGLILPDGSRNPKGPIPRQEANVS